MNKATCCAFDEDHPLHDNCISQHRYCTSGLNGINEALYERLVCPSINCPGGDPLLYNHETYNQEIILERSWNFLQKDLSHCKMKINGAAGLNGKIMVEFLDVREASVMVW